MRTAESVLGQSHHMGVIGYGNSQAQSVAQQGRQGNDAFPWEIRRVHNISRTEIRTWSTDTYRTNGFHATICLNQFNNSIC